MKTKLMHVRANISNLQKSIEWYQNVLGFELDSLYPDDNPVYADFNREKGACFSIMVDKNYPSHGRFNFDVEDIDFFWEQVKDKTEVIEPLFETPYGTKKFTIKDLDGNELGFCRENN